MRKLMALAPLLMAACSTMPAEGAPTHARSDATGQACRNEELAGFVGRERTAKVESDLLRRSGAKTVRWVPEGTMVTMEFREDRVTAYLDANDRIERVSCG